MSLGHTAKTIFHDTASEQAPSLAMLSVARTQGILGLRHQIAKANRRFLAILASQMWQYFLDALNSRSRFVNLDRLCGPSE
jgi:hypothetical protein